MNLASQTTLRDLGWRLQHHCAARSYDPGTLAEHIGMSPDDFALTLVGEHDLLFSTVCALLEQLDLDWWQLYGVELPHRRTVHHLTLESDSWHAIESGVQPFEIRRDVERYRAGDWLRLYEKVDTTWTGRVLTMEVTYLLYLASVDLPPGYVAMALRPVDVSQLTAEAPLLTVAQQDKLRARLDAYANNLDDRRQWADAETKMTPQTPEPLAG